MLAELDRALAGAERDASVRVVVVRGAGEHFCAGFDLGTVDADELVEDRLVREREQLFARSEEHTSELQSSQYLVCRLLLEKKKRELDDDPCAARQVRMIRRVHQP